MRAARRPVDPGLAERLAARTLELVDLPSESGNELAILEWIERAVPTQTFEVVDRDDAVRFFLPRASGETRASVVLAGHVDTVPVAGNLPGRRENGAIVGCGTADMKGALAVVLEIADWIDTIPGADLAVGLVFFGREELPINESALLPLFDRAPRLREAKLAIVMEPTANTIEMGCLGNLNARITVRGRSAHTARPWFGDNAIHTALDVLSSLAHCPPTEVEIDGLTYVEVVGVTRIDGGVASNVVPDRVEAIVNVRYAPTRSPAQAEERLRELINDDRAEITMLGNAPPGRGNVANPLVTRLLQAGRLDVRPKQAWTPVAEFATAGVDAVNFGPGDPEYAHRDDERVDVAALVRSYEVLREFLRGPAAQPAARGE